MVGKLNAALLGVLAACGGDDGGGSPAGGLVFTSDWSTATGLGSDAVLDTTKTPHWADSRPGQSQVEVVAAAGLGFPDTLTNVLRVTYIGSQSADVQAIDAWTTPTAGDSIYMRAYIRFSIPDSYGEPGALSNHPIEAKAGTCPFQWELSFGPRGDGMYDALWRLPDANYLATLRKDTVYRYEWGFVRQDSGMYKTYLAVYNVDGTLAAGADSFVTPNTTTTLAQDDPVIAIDDECLRSLQLGSNGPSLWDNITTDTYLYFGGVAVGRGEPIGPYVPGEHAELMR